MANYTSSLGLELITPGSQAGLWGNTTNNSLNLLDQAITGVTPYSGFAGVTGATWVPTDYNGAQDEARAAVFNFTGTATGPNTVEIPNKQKTYFVRNGTGQDIVFKTAIGTTPCTVGAGYNLPIFCDGNNNVFLAILAPGAGTLTVTGGGTGVTNFAAGGFVKSSGGANALTASPTVNASSEISGTLPVVNGGTGKSSVTAGVLLQGNGTATLTEFVGGVNGYIPTWNASTNAWVAQAPAIAGVSTITAGGGILVNGGSGPASGPVTISNSGVTSATAGSGILLSGSTGGITITNNGVLSVGAGTGISVSGTGGALTVSNTGVLTVNGQAGAVSVTTTSIGAYPSSNPSGYITSSALSNYVTNASLSSTLSGYVTNSSLSSTLSGYATTSSLSSYAPISNPTFSGTVLSSSAAFNMTYTSSIYWSAASGFVGISANGITFAFYQSGNALAVSGSWLNGSDSRIKENVAPLQGGLDKVLSLNPVEFSYKKDSLTSANKFGLIAQDALETVPRIVSTVKDDTTGIDDLHCVDYVSLVPVLIKAVQELKSEIDALKAAK